MKKNLLLLPLILFFLSVHGKQKENPATEKWTEPRSADLTSALFNDKSADVSMEDTIKTYCKSGTLENFRLAKAVMDTCSHENTLAWLYNFIHDSLINAVNEGIRKSHPEVIYSADDRPMATWSELPKYFPLIVVDLLCGECSVEAMVNIAPFIKIAAKTKGESDDAYFELLRLMYYSEGIGDTLIFEGGGNINNWMTMDGCDFCSYSELGSGAILKMFQQREKVMGLGNLFKEKSKNYSGFFEPNKYDTHFGYSKEAVTTELSKILKTIILTVEERKNLEETLQKIKSGVGIQFNCKNGGCKYDVN